MKIFLAASISLLFAASSAWAASFGYVGNTNSNPSLQPLYKGYKIFEEDHIHKVRVITLCNDDGSHCGEPYTVDRLQRILDKVNAIHFRSGSNMRFEVDDGNDLSETFYSDAINNVFVPQDGIHILPMEIDGQPGHVLADDSGIIDTGDLNGDGKTGTEQDANYLTRPYETHEKQPFIDYTQAINEVDGVIPIALVNGWGTVTWREDLSMWVVARQSGGGASWLTSRHITVRRSIDTVAGALFAHESGHFFGLPHTFVDGFKTTDAVAAKIKEHVESGAASPSEHDKILTDLFDGDKLPDTPPDVRSWIFEDAYRETHGEDADLACRIFPDHVNVDVSFSNLGTYTYTLAPDRRNVMSYFWRCFPGYEYYSPSQIRVMRGIAAMQKRYLSHVEDRPTWRNDTNKEIPAPTTIPCPAGKFCNTQPRLNYVTSYIEVEDADPTHDEVIVGFDLQNPSGVYIELVSPSGVVIPLQEPKHNVNKVSGHIKTLYVKKIPNKKANGLWSLRVAQAPTNVQHRNYGDGYISFWQLQFRKSKVLRAENTTSAQNDKEVLQAENTTSRPNYKQVPETLKPALTPGRHLNK